MKILSSLVIMFSLALAVQADAAVIVSQYYEGAGSNKFIELKNVGGTAFDLGTLRIGRWSNNDREGYKNDLAPGFSTALSGSLAAEGIFLIAASGAAAPAYALPPDLTSAVASFNGDDSIGVYTVTSGTTFETANLVDAIGFTSATQGLDTSFVRVTTAPGFDLTFGSSVDTFPDAWDEASILSVNNAEAGSDLRLGVSAVAVPEPSGLACLAVTGAAVVGRRMRRKSVDA